MCSNLKTASMPYARVRLRTITLPHTFAKRGASKHWGEISPILPKSCRYIPTCSEYSMEAYKRYGAVKGTVLTAWRICRCNPLGGHGYDPPRWFGEVSPLEDARD